MANSLKLYVSTQNNKLVQSDTDASDFTLPTFFQGDVLVSSENTPMAGGCSRSHLAVSSLPVTRLLKKQPWPIDRFVFDTEGEANEAAEKLRSYLL